MKSKNNIPRGIRLNNPCNLRKGQGKFVGEFTVSKDKQFRQFKSMSWGIRAALHLLVKTYYELHHLHTVRKIINRWAPSVENDTAAYIHAMCQELGIKPDADIPSSAEFWTRFLDAMIFVENGQRVDRCEISAVVNIYFPFFVKS